MTAAEIGKRDARFAKEHSWLHVVLDCTIKSYKPDMAEICEAVGIRSNLNSWHECQKVRNNPAFQDGVTEAILAYESEFFVN